MWQRLSLLAAFVTMFVRYIHRETFDDEWFEKAYSLVLKEPAPPYISW